MDEEDRISIGTADVGSVLSTFPNKDSDFYGIFGKGKEVKDNFWRIECPCGTAVTYPINGLPEVNTPMPCGKSNHWAVKYED